MNAHKLAAVLGLASAASYAPTSSAYVHSEELANDVQSAVHGPTGDVRIAIHGDTVTLFGQADIKDRRAAEKAALASPGVSRVVNLITDQAE